MLLQEVSRRSLEATPLLQAQLTGVFAVRLSDTGKTYTFDWSGEKLMVSQIANPLCECTIVVSQQNLLRIAAGEMNPQLAMLSDKVRVEGKAPFAVYFFNLIAPL